MSTPIFAKICALLDEKGINYKTFHHNPTLVSADTARELGIDLHSGAKALVVQGAKSGKYFLCVVPGDTRLSNEKARKVFGENVSFAKDPVAVTGCVKGSVPPLGSVINLSVYCDKKLAENKIINFNAGSLTDSIEMQYIDYLIVENPQLVDIT